MKNLKKVAFFVIIAAFFMISFSCKAAAASDVSAQNTSSASQKEIMDEQKKRSGADALQEKVPESAKKGINGLHINGADRDSLARFTPANIFNSIVESLKTSALSPIKAIAAVLAVLLSCALLNTLKSTYGEASLQGVFDIVCSLCIASIILLPVSQCVAYCADTIGSSSKFMMGFLPVYSALTAVSGHPASAVAAQSLLLVVSEALAGITSTTFVPMVDMYLAFCVVGAVSPGVNIAGVAEFVKKAVSWAMGICITVYTGILTVQGVIASAADNVTVKTAKFVVGAVPVVGGAISDAMNTVISCTGLLKTTVGAYAIVVFILAFLPPVLECIMWLLAADLSLAVSDILGIGNMSGLLKAVREALRLIVALVLSSALAFIVSVSVMLLVGK